MMTIIRLAFGIAPGPEDEPSKFYRLFVTTCGAVESLITGKKSSESLWDQVNWATSSWDDVNVWQINEDNKEWALAHASAFTPGRKAVAFSVVIPPDR